jgi:hypothetical protein
MFSRKKKQKQAGDASDFKKYRFLLVTLVFVFAIFTHSHKAFALTYLVQPSVYLTNMNTAGASSVIVEFTTSASNTGTNGSLVFSGWTGSGGTGTVATSQTVTNTVTGVNCTTITGAAANLPGSPTAAGTAGTGTIAITDATALAANTNYCYVLTNAITANPTAAGQTNVFVTAGSDTAGSTAIDIISNDQVVVSATTPPLFTMALSANSDAFASNLSTSSIIATGGINVTINTNAKNGWHVWGSDTNTGIRSTTQSYTVAAKTPGTNATLSTGNEGYLSGISGITQGSGAGTTSATTAYASSGSGNGSGLDGTERQIASSTGTASGAIVPVKEYATISSVTPAATDYSDTIILLGAGSF